ncbi:hypothetical protein SAMN05892883_0619 [Jatrophihabitans sp. GAS493]|uniref:hypothetical protein n=1 Tax=Jatrophihabitans sp. GAS493 TaxID=1907575 RepID=UPI000BB70773|nr:hypothetical protein [Jatrophihabitans sp. GAS493]SOD71013.1 hypothetical protein SAMN05892883_0619 [Jatrophihabitans sp. GAS493]
MAARLIGFAILGIVLFIALLAAVYLISKSRQPNGGRREKDISVRPSLWWADSRAINEGHATEFSIIRVDQRTQEVLERRILSRIANSLPDYQARLDAEQDKAYEIARTANVGLYRR